MKNNEISVIIPAHNSERIIEKSLISLANFFSSLYRKYELIVVANACIDNTAEIVKKLCRKNKNIILIEIDKKGKGRAILTGLGCSKYEITGFIDADDVFSHYHLKKMLSFLGDYDCVIASKWLGKKFSQVKEPFSRKIFAVGWNILARILLRLNFRDTQGGAKFFRRKAFLSIDRNFICLGWDFDIELLFKLKQKKYKIKEFYVPITTIFKFSVFRLRYIPRMFFNILRLWSKKG